MNGTINMRLKYPSAKAKITKTILVPTIPRSKSIATEPIIVGI